MPRRAPKVTWITISRAAGLTIVGAVMVGWFRGQDVTSPTIAMLAGGGLWLCGVSGYVAWRRESRAVSDRDSGGPT